MNYSKIQRLIRTVWSGVGVLVLIAVVMIVFMLQKEEFYGSVRTALIIYLVGDVVINIGNLLINKRQKSKDN